MGAGVDSAPPLQHTAGCCIPWFEKRCSTPPETAHGICHAAGNKRDIISPLEKSQPLDEAAQFAKAEQQ